MKWFAITAVYGNPVTRWLPSDLHVGADPLYEPHPP